MKPCLLDPLSSLNYLKHSWIFDRMWLYSRLISVKCDANNEFYIDDFLSDAYSLESAIQKSKLIREKLQSAKLPLGKYFSNSPVSGLSGTFTCQKISSSRIFFLWNRKINQVAVGTIRWFMIHSSYMSKQRTSATASSSKVGFFAHCTDFWPTQVHCSCHNSSKDPAAGSMAGRKRMGRSHCSWTW